jgi:hypothetical protein
MEARKARKRRNTKRIRKSTSTVRKSTTADLFPPLPPLHNLGLSLVRVIGESTRDTTGLEVGTRRDGSVIPDQNLTTATAAIPGRDPATTTVVTPDPGLVTVITNEKTSVSLSSNTKTTISAQI